MDNNALAYHLTKVFSELEIRIAERVLSLLTEQGMAAGMSAGSEMLLNDKQICEHLQISISHFHNFKKAHADFPSYAIGKNVRYKLSEVKEFIKNVKK
ncbi:helix-turn-helix domain-containing protein [Chryseobacterium aquaticum]|uniref:Helix-turn-helix domain-containing protein n=1 Tax=Chryseobacterium aquaticum TaxID=452084 RepID=A0A848N2X4_9FLAO|nr:MULTISPECIES: helix-turn-helix domain-containing protein [Chryseobacterium]NMR34716.1 helix-turn-helix domain-containing protein [Chryseobacterium aquaticum]NRQ46896.1 helix-turn-helix domain-containing protein [Chryseobacterium sp. C-204]